MQKDDKFFSIIFSATDLFLFELHTKAAAECRKNAHEPSTVNLNMCIKCRVNGDHAI